MPIDVNNLAGTAKMTFDDEFNSLSLWNGTSGTWDTNYWYNPLNGNGSSLSGNGEQEWYINNNYGATSSIKPWTVSNGVLNLTANPAPASIQPLINNYKYTSGMLNSYTSFSQTYGYFEMRAELPAGQGLWPAFWLLPENGQWPPELDIMEMLGNNPSTIYTTVHSTTLPGNQTAQADPVVNTSTGYHTYGVDWEPDYITWYFDGKVIDKVATPKDLNTPMYMILNLAVGGGWPGNANSTTPFPADMKVDWVRAYQSLPASTGGGSTSSGTGGSTSGTGSTPSSGGSGSTTSGGGGSPTGSTGSTGSTSGGSTSGGSTSGSSGSSTGSTSSGASGLHTVGAATTLANSAGWTSAAVLSNGELVLGESHALSGGAHQGAASLYQATTGAEVGSTIALNGQVASGTTLTPQVTALTDGYWKVGYTGAGAPVGYEIHNSSGAQVFVDNASTKGTPVFSPIDSGGYVVANSASATFTLGAADGSTSTFQDASVGGHVTAPTAITPLSYGGFVFSYAGSTQLDFYSRTGAHGAPVQLGAAASSYAMATAELPLGQLGVAWLSPPADGSANMKLTVELFNTNGKAFGHASTVAIDADPWHTQIQLVSTGKADQAVVLWSQGGAVWAAFDNADAGTVSTPKALIAGSLSGMTETALSNGTVAVTWTQTDNGVQDVWAGVLNPTTMAFSQHLLGAGSGAASVVATANGGFAASWHSGSAVMGAGYYGDGNYTQAGQVAGDFIGVDSAHNVVALGHDATGQAVLQHYALGVDPLTGH